MVIRLLFIFSLLAVANNVSAQESSQSLSADELERLFGDSERQRQSASDRLKASRIDKKNLRILNDKDIHYKLPDGNYVPGILLPNGLVAPAIRNQFELRPACVTKNYQLVPGTWDNDNNVIQCNLESSELAFLTPDGAAQVGSNGAPPAADKYRVESTSSIEPDNNDDRQAHADTATDNQTTTQQVHRANKYGESEQQTASANRSDTIAGVNNANRYIPPPRNSSSTKSTVGVLRLDTKEFGISMGTWIRAELIRNVTSAEAGQIEFRLLETVEGRYKDLPAGTVLFANKQFNDAARRLEALTTTGILPNGDEFNGINAYVYADDKTAGLTGAIIRDREGEVAAAGAQTLLGTAAKTLDGSVGGEAVADFTQELVDNERRNAPKTPKAYIQVVQQQVWLKVSKTF